MDFPATLLHGARATGLWESLLEAASGLLCEAPGRVLAPWQSRACGTCAGCHLVRAGTHPDLRVVLPAALAAELGWGAEEGAEAGQGEAKGAAAGREISIEQVRALIDWAQGTSHRGGPKVALVHPLDAMAAPAANALLKVLEEPPASLCFLTGTHQLDRVLPTLRSRCSLRAWKRPGPEAALAELQRRGQADAQAVLHWSRRAVFEADPARGLDWTRRLVRQLAEGRVTQLDGVTPAQALESLQKLTLDLVRVRSGLAPSYLAELDAPLRRLAGRGDTGAWLQWWQRLAQAARTPDFPVHAGLAVQAWVVELQQLCTSGTN
ncbi:MAG: DNA polymerase III subunit delta' [Betaproteobacteria bacterium]|jgi:DNA polymerase III subunit delta'|nr:DNA polymerase III subunit delta' [Betaproteobacteria bacterium]MDE2153442.1 DNA polymerase III subunit delta' [Betaproteobacteria bacterium]